MKQSVIVGALMLVAASASAKTVYIRDGVTDWTSGDSYYGGEAPVAGDIVVVSNKTEVTVSSDDAASCALVASLSSIRPMYNQSRVIFDIASDSTLELNASVYNPEGSVNGFWGELVKRGSGELKLAACDQVLSGNYTYDYKVGTISVEAGTLRCPEDVPKREQQFGNIYVASGATFILSKFDTNKGGSMGYYINGTLTGGGTVNSPVDGTRQLRVYKNSEFSGKLTGRIELFVSAEWDLTGEESTTAATPMVWSLASPATPGLIGVKKFGNGGEVSSLGSASVFAIDYRGGGYRYLGNGETTDKQLRISSSTVNPALFDAGPNGGITFTGSWYINGTPDQMHELVLKGSNTTAAVLANDISSWTKNNYPYDFQIVKEGTGTWRFNEVGTRTWAGALHVRDGVIEFDSLREAGQICALGFATNCALPYLGVYDPTKQIDYAIGLGSDTGYPTLRYVGSSAGSSTTRKIQLTGQGGRLASNGGELALSGITAAANTTPTLTLDAQFESTHYLRNVDEGEGEIAVVKTGAGKWVMDGNLDFSGGITVSNGTLEVKSISKQYTWYRFTVKRVAGGGQYFNTVEMAMYDQDGNQVFLRPERVDTESLNTWQWSDGDYRALEPGQVGYAKAGWYKNDSYSSSDVRDLRQAFNGWAGNDQPSSSIYYGGSGDSAVAKGIEPTDPDSWLVFVFRLPENCPKVVAYDMMCSSDYGRQWRPSCFTLEGSRDGIFWTTLHEMNYSSGDASSGAYQWMSDGTTTAGTGSAPAVRPNTGWTIAAESTESETTLSNLGKVGIAGTGKLVLNVAATVSELNLNTANAGTCSGLTIAASGTLNLQGTLGSGDILLGTQFDNCTNLTNLEQWSVTCNGVPLRRKIQVVGNKIKLIQNGMYMILY